MSYIPTRYRSAYFADLSNFRPSPDTITPLVQVFVREELLPTLFHEISPAMQPQVRLRLVSANEEWSVDFELDRLSIQKKAIKKPRGEDLGTPEEFTTTSCDFLGRIMEKFPLIPKAHRLSLVSNGRFEGLDEVRLAGVYRRLFNSFGPYAVNDPVEWAWRSVVRVDEPLAERMENLNLLTDVKRVRAKSVEGSATVECDRIDIMLDINTYQRHTESRFNQQDAASFYGIAVRQRSEILRELEAYANV